MTQARTLPSAPRARACTADEIAALFAERLPDTGGGLTVKQVNWLFSVAEQEIRRGGYHGPIGRSVNGRLADGRFWTLNRMPNGAGYLKLNRPGESHEEWSTRANEEARRREVKEK